MGRKKLSRRRFIKQSTVIGAAISITPKIIAKPTNMKNKTIVLSTWKHGVNANKKAWKILNESQNSGYKGWYQFGSKQNRYWLCENFLNPEFKDVRNASYDYHLNGVDVFYNRPDDSRTVILENINKINSINSKNFNSTIITLFINAKADEITNIFKGASLDQKRNAFNLMNELSPSKSDLFNKILQ